MCRVTYGITYHMKQVKKRNGSIVDFEATKITDALRKSFAYCEVAIDEAGLEALTKGVIEDLSAKFGDEATPSVEHVQDLVELALMEAGYLTVAKHYIVYRYEHAKVREEKKQETTGDPELDKLIQELGGWILPLAASASTVIWRSTRRRTS